ncbi:hypothetical protein MAR_035092 [Mya arenaria]|uniref:Uncharacterized protein n=1 Tax=Mya arenaria TaxID=6604 RepID=A0ABY7ES47_MYAAR|nr:hypothetical protein MAR_035092 [Mya arenaria]
MHILEAAPTFVAESTAFHAYLSTDVNLNSHDVIKFDVEGEAFADSEEITDTHSSSATTVVQMAAGDQAWVRRGADSQSVLWSHPSRGRSTFTGWLLL